MLLNPNAEGTLVTNAATMLGHFARDISIAQAVEIARERYAIEATARKLAGERDSNFHLHARDGRQFMLKVVNPAEDPSVTNFQTSALLHVLKSDPSFVTQRIVPAIDGSPDFQMEFPGEGRRAVRMVTFVEGVMQRDSTPTPKQLYGIGATLARLQLALAGFDHPSAEYPMAWDIKRAAELRSRLSVVVDPERRSAFEGRLDRLETTLLPALACMRSQVVHNDLNSDNIIVDPRDQSLVVALIDFGDMIRTAAICDAAIAAAYQLSEETDLLEPARHLVAGFHSRVPLEASEIDILFDLILTRMVARILITEWRAGLFPENRDYILRNTSRTWRQLEQLMRLSETATTAAFRRMCRRSI